MADRFDSGGVESLQHVERQGGKEEEGGWSGGEGRRQFPWSIIKVLNSLYTT